MDYNTRVFPLLAYLALIRPKQWIKNGFVFMPLLFSGHFLQAHCIQQSIMAFIVFCLSSSSAYILNDICDINQDKAHPTKSTTRPLASGVVPVFSAYLMLMIFLTLLTVACLLMPALLIPVIAYLFLNVAYSFVLKHEPVIDIFIIALGFVLRIYAGATAIQVSVSSWMFVTTLSLALYLAAIKRRQELLLHPNRNVLKKYSLTLIDRYAEISAICAILFYSLFVMSTRPELVLTIPIVLLGIFRYWFLVDQQNQGESPTELLYEDWQLSFTIIIWLGTCIWLLWP